LSSQPASAPQQTAPKGESLVGRTLGAYQLHAVIGEGGMGRVYLGEHKMIGRKVAVKVLSADVAGDAEVVARFFTEARAVNDIRHPNIVEVTDFGNFEGKPFIVMEYLEGETLADRLTKVRQLDERAAARVVGQVASALGAAHERGLVHRDLKPANIFLRAHPDYPDFVKVLDFGIAKLTSGAPALHQTQVGAVIGTPAYMSPEQCVGDRNLDHRSDVYSLGVVLYLAVTGRLPFEGDTLGRLILSHVGQQPPAPAVVRPGVSPLMNAIIMRTLEKKPERRYPNMRELRHALREVGEYEVTAVRRSPLLGPGPTPTPTPLAVPATVIRPSAEGTGPTMLASPATAAAALASSKEGTGERGFAERFVALGRSHLSDGQWKLPPLSSRLIRILEACASPGFSFASVTSLVVADPRLSSHVIVMANTPPFAGHTPATTLQQAIGRLGASGLRSAVFEVALRPLIELRERTYEESYRRPWPRALAVATVCQRLFALHGNDDAAGDAYIAGLLHDVGRPLAGTTLLEMERQVRAASGRRVLSNQGWLDGVEALFRQVGAALALHWNLSAPIAEAVLGSDAFDASKGFSLRNTLRTAAGLADTNGFPTRRGDEPRGATIAEEGRVILGVDAALVARAVQGLRERVAGRL
jgi:serine/threonine protein kinase